MARSRLAMTVRPSLRPIVENDLGGPLGLQGSLTVALSRGDRAALHEHVPDIAEHRPILDVRPGRQVAHEGAYLRQMAGRRDMQWIVGLILEQHVDEGAALEVLDLEPIVIRIEDRQQPLLGIGGANADFTNQPILGPQGLAPIEEREHEVLLRFEMAVQCHLGDAGPLNNSVHADRTRALMGEQIVRRL